MLGLVRAAGTATPYDLKAGVAGSLGYFWAIPHSQLYAAPDRLVGRGFLTVEQEPGGRRRKAYAVTPAGEAALETWLQDPPTGLPEMRTPALLGIFFGADPRSVAETQLPLHRARLAEYERILALGEQAPAGTNPGPITALRAGILSEGSWIAYYEELLG